MWVFKESEFHRKSSQKKDIVITINHCVRIAPKKIFHLEFDQSDPPIIHTKTEQKNMVWGGPNVKKQIILEGAQLKQA